MATIALVDDDENIVESLKVFFEAEGYKVRAYHDGATALAGLSETPPDIAILDIKMPKMDGIEVLRKLRQTSNLPVIFLTSKDDEIDEVVGFNIGADDYIQKPCSTRLLAERVKAILRRSRGASATPEDGDKKPIVRGRLTLDPNRHACPWNGKLVRLTVTEFLILQALAPAARLCEKPRPADGRGLRRSGLCRRPHHRQPHQAAAQEVPRSRRQFRCDRDAVRRRVSL